MAQCLAKTRGLVHRLERFSCKSSVRQHRQHYALIKCISSLFLHVTTAQNMHLYNATLMQRIHCIFKTAHAHLGQLHSNITLCA